MISSEGRAPAAQKTGGRHAREAAVGENSPISCHY